MTFAIGASMFGFGVGGGSRTGPWWAKPLAVIDLARCWGSRPAMFPIQILGVPCGLDL